jgi:hypothetical protein
MLGFEILGYAMLIESLFYIAGTAFLSLMLSYFCKLLKIKTTYLKALSVTLTTSLVFIIVWPFLYLTFYSTIISLMGSYLIALPFFFILIKTTWQKTITLYLLLTAAAIPITYILLYIISKLNF